MRCFLPIDFPLSFFSDYQKYRSYTAQNARYFLAQQLDCSEHTFLPVASSGRGAQGDREGRPYISCRCRGLEI
jgi:hypothetical protein